MLLNQYKLNVENNISKAFFFARNEVLHAKVRFKIYRDCLPLHGSSFRHTIEYKYQKGFKFNQELNKQQPMLLQPVQNQSGLPFLKDSCAQLIKSQQVQQTGLQQHDCYRPQLDIGHVHPCGSKCNSVATQLCPANFRASESSTLFPSPQQHYFGSTTNMGHSHSPMVTSLLTSNDRYLVEVQELSVAGNPTNLCQTSIKCTFSFSWMSWDLRVGSLDWKRSVFGW
ncbi:hypothetical protein CRYUN_Cryun13aG0011300 [Craigia yunnanensis]